MGGGEGSGGWLYFESLLFVFLVRRKQHHKMNLDVMMIFNDIDLPAANS